MSDADVLRSAARRVFAGQLERHLALHGAASVGIVCEGIIEAVVTVSLRIAGREATRAAIWRFVELLDGRAPEPTPTDREGE